MDPEVSIDAEGLKQAKLLSDAVINTSWNEVSQDEGLDDDRTDRTREWVMKLAWSVPYSIA